MEIEEILYSDPLNFYEYFLLGPFSNIYPDRLDLHTIVSAMSEVRLKEEQHNNRKRVV